MTELERYKKALEQALHLFGLLRHAADSKNSADLADGGILLVDKALRPPPEMETVEVGTWAIYWNDGSMCRMTGQEPINLIEGQTAVKLTGTFHRPKPQPVERSLSFPCSVTQSGEIRARFDLIVPFSPDQYLHAESRDSMDGKRGVITFTWTEPQ